MSPLCSEQRRTPQDTAFANRVGMPQLSCLSAYSTPERGTTWCTVTCFCIPARCWLLHNQRLYCSSTVGAKAEAYGSKLYNSTSRASWYFTCNLDAVVPCPAPDPTAKTSNRYRTESLNWLFEYMKARSRYAERARPTGGRAGPGRGAGTRQAGCRF